MSSFEMSLLGFLVLFIMAVATEARPDDQCGRPESQTLNQQCQNYGYNDGLCPLPDGIDRCFVLACAVNEMFSVRGELVGVVMDGTPCGTNRFCESGLCRPVSSEIEANEDIDPDAEWHDCDGYNDISGYFS